MSFIRSIQASVLSGLVVAALSSAAFAADESANTATAATPASAAPAASAAKSGSVGRSCDDVKAEIEGKLTAKGVKGYTLDIVAKDEVNDAKVVGNCEGGSKRITYKKG